MVAADEDPGQGHLEEGHIPQEEGQTHPEGGLEAGVLEEVLIFETDLQMTDRIETDHPMKIEDELISQRKVVISL